MRRLMRHLVKRHVSPMAVFRILIAFCIATIVVVPATAFYLPGMYPKAHAPNDTLNVNVNSLTSNETGLSFSYYSLPFCQPEEGIQRLDENFGEVLIGDLIENSPFKFRTLVKQRAVKACDVGPLTEADVEDLKSKIDGFYHVNFLLDNLPVTLFSLEDNEGDILTGIPIGYNHNGQYYLYNHILFKVLVHEYVESPAALAGMSMGYSSVDVFPQEESYTDQGSSPNGTAVKGFVVVGFESAACSIRRSPDPEIPRYSTLDPIDCFRGDPQPIAPGESIVVSFDVLWEKSPIQWASRWDAYLKMRGDKVHWFSILNSLVVISCLAAAVFAILLRSVHRDLARINSRDKEEAQQLADESGWKLLVGDIFRSPPHPEVLCIIVSNGSQLLCMAVVTIFFAALGFMSPASRGALLMGMVLFYLLLSVVSGYVASRMWVAQAPCRSLCSPTSSSSGSLLSATIFLCYSLLMSLAIFLATGTNGGPTEYHTLTRFPGMPARLVAAYYTDCTYHLQHQCDPVLKAFSPLSACPVTGVHKGRFERKYPLCAAREYVLAWKVWEMWGGCGAVRGGGGAGMEREEEEKGEEGGVRGVEGGEVVFCVTKAIEDETVPRKSKPKRVDIYNCGWRVQDVVLPDGRKAAEIEMVVRDDCGIQRDMAKMAFRRGAWGYVCNTLAHIRGYVQLHPHLLLPPPAPPSAGFEALLGENSVQSQQEQEQQEQEEEEERGEEMDRVQQTVLLSKDGSSSNRSSRVVDQDGMFPAGDAAAAAAATGVGAQAEVSSSLAALSASTSGAREAGAALSRSLAAQASLPRLLRFTPRPGLSLSRAFSCLRFAAAATAAGIGSSRSRSFFAATPEPGSSAALSLASASGPGGSGLGSAAAGASMARTSDGKRVLLLRGVVPVVAVAAMGLGVGGLLVVHCGAAGAASKVLLACTLRSMWVGAQRESPQEGPSQAGRKEARK
ncbi:unnamed protein product [Closterium sp. Naga37s-1]|nr:unnamed protein product [Closterium sp. Naga37s-1]